MRKVFVVSASALSDVAVAVHAHHQHIYVVKAAHAVVFHVFELILYYILYRRPAVENIARRTPAVGARFLYPHARIVGAP